MQSGNPASVGSKKGATSLLPTTMPVRLIFTACWYMTLAVQNEKKVGEKGIDDICEVTHQDS